MSVGRGSHSDCSSERCDFTDTYGRLCRSLRSFHWSILSFHSKSIAFYCIMHHSIEPGDAYDSDIMDASGNEGQCDLRRR